MNEHSAFAICAVAVSLAVMTMIISITIYETNKSNLEAQAVPQVVIESETP